MYFKALREGRVHGGHTYVLGRNDFGQYAGQAGISRQGVYLISGASGLGKTAILYEWLAKFRREGIRCAFISAEEQANKIRATIIRLGLDDDLRTMSVLCTGDFGETMTKVVEADIEIVVVDSLNKIKDFGDPTKGENETSPPYPVPLRGIQVKIRVFEPDSRQVREVTVVQDFLPQ
jgi:KaiC/GvpD/RAD55 family RecA-like ATPase